MTSLKHAYEPKWHQETYVRRLGQLLKSTQQTYDYIQRLNVVC